MISILNGVRCLSYPANPRDHPSSLASSRCPFHRRPPTWARSREVWLGLPRSWGAWAQASRLQRTSPIRRAPSRSRRETKRRQRLEFEALESGIKCVQFEVNTSLNYQ